MELGAFSISLNVADLEKSKTFYQHLGFTKKGGDESQGWLVLQNGSSTVGLFQGMFERNMLTFNPGWDAKTNTLESFDDVRELQRELLNKGVAIENQVDESSSGPGSFVVVDPDGNPILIDQHV